MISSQKVNLAEFACTHYKCSATLSLAEQQFNSDKQQAEHLSRTKWFFKINSKLHKQPQERDIIYSDTDDHTSLFLAELDTLCSRREHLKQRFYREHDLQNGRVDC